MKKRNLRDSLISIKENDVNNLKISTYDYISNKQTNMKVIVLKKKEKKKKCCIYEAPTPFVTCCRLEKNDTAWMAIAKRQPVVPFELCLLLCLHAMINLDR